MKQPHTTEPALTETDIDKTLKVDITVTQQRDFSAPDLQKTVVNQTDTRIKNIKRSPHSEKKPLKIGSKLKDRFLLLEVLGEGGMGVVYKARDFRKDETHDNEPFVAIKVLTKELQQQKILVIALQRETKKAQKLAHPNIITVYDFDRDGDNVFMTMEYLEGETLDAIIKRASKQDIDQKLALSIIEQMGRALAYAHKRGIVHSDLKPGNVFVTRSGVVKVLDFGIARAAALPGHQVAEDDVFDASDLQALTPVYASKEMLEGQASDPRDDIYGMAVVACQLLTGEHPFNRFSASKAHSVGFKPLYINKLPRKTRNALMHALEFDREKRTPSATQFLQELDLRPRSKKSRTRRFIEVAVFLIVMLVTVYGTRHYLGGKTPPLVLQETAAISDPALRQKVENLLEIAEVHTLVNRLMDPPGSSAYYAYRQVLELHKNNKAAYEGLRKIADHYEKLARQDFMDGNPERALQLVDKGLIALPAHEGLLKFRKELVEKSNPDTAQ